MQVPDFNPEYVFWWVDAVCLLCFWFIMSQVVGRSMCSVLKCLNEPWMCSRLLTAQVMPVGLYVTERCVCVIACYYIIKYACLPRWLEWLGRWTHNSVVANSIAGCCSNYYWHEWPSSGGQTTSVFHQATQANSASYFQQNGKWVPAKVWWCSAAGE